MARASPIACFNINILGVGGFDPRRSSTVNNRSSDVSYASPSWFERDSGALSAPISGYVER
jgi:hypothetical protein